MEGKVLKVNVSVSIDLLSIVRINQESHSIEFQFRIWLEWRENRATYHNLKEMKFLNILMQDDVQRIWLPEVVYENTDQKKSTRLGETWEWSTSVLVKKEGDFSRSDLSSVDETEIFKGGENSLIMEQTYTHEFQCVYNLRYYPFDTQVSCFFSVKRLTITSICFQMCKISMGLRDIHNETIALIPEQLRMMQDPEMSCFSVIDWNLEQRPGNGVEMVIVFRRKITGEMMTTYFPSLLLIAITFATTFFKPFFFEAALSVNLTTMLVMTTIFISKMESLPSTSQIRMIDMWLVLCQLLPFIEVVLLTAMEYFRETENTDKEQMGENKGCMTKKGMSRNERCIVSLKFLGRKKQFSIIFHVLDLNIYPFFREESVAHFRRFQLFHLHRIGDYVLLLRRLTGQPCFIITPFNRQNLVLLFAFNKSSPVELNGTWYIQNLHMGGHPVPYICKIYK